MRQQGTCHAQHMTRSHTTRHYVAFAAVENRCSSSKGDGPLLMHHDRVQTFTQVSVHQKPEE